MTKEELQQLYKAKVLPENRDPYHFEPQDAADDIIEAYNPFCGDKFTLFLKDSFDKVHFHGIGCAISKASTSILLKKIEGRTEKEVKAICTQFLAVLEGGKDLENLTDEDLYIMASLKQFDGRMDCVKLSWKALNDYLEKK